MRIGIDARMYGSSFTGIGRYTAELIRYLLAIDRENRYVIFFNEPSYSLFKPDRRDVEKVRVDTPHYSWKEQRSFLFALKRKKLDLMHFTHFNAPVLYRPRSVVTIHDLTITLFPGKKKKDFLHRLGYGFVLRSIVRRTKKIIAVSEYTKRDLQRYLHADPKKIVVIHEGVDPAFHVISDSKIIHDFLKRMNLQQPYLLYTGVWRSHKNLINLLKAFSILKKKKLFPGVLVITGKEDPWYPEVQELVKQKHLEGLIRFTGFVPDEDMPLLYNGAALYVFPSLYEGFGLPALEAFACGLPVCAANSSSLPEICGKGNADFFDPHDPSDIADSIARVYNDEAYRKTLISRGLTRVKDFSWKRMAEQTLEVYKEAVKNV